MERVSLNLRRIAHRMLAAARSDRGFVLSIVAGALARVALALTTTNSYDLWFFGSVAVAAKAHRPLYADTTFSYPPLWGYAFEDAGKLLAFLHVPVLVRVPELAPYAIPGLTKLELTTPLASFLLKLPALLVDAALAWTLYRATLRLGGSVAGARTVALALWLNPLALITAPIQANWDAIVPLTMLAAIACALEERWLVAGAIAAIGVWSKLTPLFFAFCVPALVYVPGAGKLRTFVLRAGGMALGACIASAAILIPVIVHGEFSAMLAAVFARTGTFEIGGANMLAFAQLNEAVALREWIVSHRAPYGRFVLLLTLLGCLLPATLLLRRAARDFRDYCAAAVALLAAICIVSPFAQPTYVIWVVPITTFLATTDGRWWRTTALLTIAGCIFFATVRAPQALLEPACVFYRVCNAAVFGAQSVDYSIAPGFRHNSLQVTIDVIAGEIIGFAMLATYAFAVRALVATTNQAPLTPIATRAPHRRSRAYVLGGGLAALCACTLSPLPGSPRLEIAGRGDRAIVGAVGFSGYAYACAVARSAPRITAIDAYFDARYPALRGVTPTFAGGFAAHFVDAMQRKNLDVPFATVSAGGLRALLSEPPHGRALFVLGGALPANVRARGFDLLKSWLLAGGTVFWAGGPFDLVWSRENPANPSAAFGGPDPDMWPTLYSTRGDTIFAREQNVFAPPVTYGTRTDARWHVPGFEFTRTTFPLNSGPLLHAGGTILGYLDSNLNSSASSMPVGRGTLVFFADAFDDEIAAADSLTQLLLCGTWSPQTPAARYDGYLAGGGEPMTIALPHDTAYVRAFGDVDGLGPYAYERR